MSQSHSDQLYRFIGDETQVRLFYQKQIKPFNETPYLAYLFLPTARRKNHPELARSQMVTCTRTFSSRQSEDRFVEELRRYEIREGTFVDNRNGSPLPSSALNIYITLDPLHEIRGYYKMQKEVADRMEKMVMNSIRSEPTLELPSLNIVSIYKSSLHSCPERIFKKLDVDTKEPEKIAKLRAMMKANQIIPHLVVETKNGFHVVLIQKELPGIPELPLSLEGLGHQALHQFEQAHKDWVTIEKNALIIIPGTYQAGFLAKVVEWN